jgi:hypothetical protein
LRIQNSRCGRIIDQRQDRLRLLERGDEVDPGGVGGRLSQQIDRALAVGQRVGRDRDASVPET